MCIVKAVVFCYLSKCDAVLVILDLSLKFVNLWLFPYTFREKIDLIDNGCQFLAVILQLHYTVSISRSIKEDCGFWFIVVTQNYNYIKKYFGNIELCFRGTMFTLSSLAIDTMLKLLVDTRYTVKCRIAIKTQFLYFNLYISVMMDSLSCSFTSIFFLIFNTNLMRFKCQKCVAWYSALVISIIYCIVWKLLRFTTYDYPLGLFKCFQLHIFFLFSLIYLVLLR
jgi:hypothetical protein